MLHHYKLASPIEFHKTLTDDKAQVIVDQILAGRGVCFVVQEGGEINGMLLAIKAPNLWSDEHMVMQELAYWVEPHRRGSTAGYRLIDAYRKYCEELKDQGSIEYYTISKMSTSPDLDYERFGFEFLESTWRQ